MRVLLQRVSQAKVIVEGQVRGEVGRGLLLLVAIAPDDTDLDLERMASKIVNLRIFEDDGGKMNRSALDEIGDERDASFGLLVVSQFTLYADVRKGRRPSFVGAAPPGVAAPMIDRWAGMLAAQGFRVEQGVFGADMAVHLINDGPVTLWLDSADLGYAASIAREGR
ncbi:MAG: D-aminoacyl-tRNA deacylase [uncultured Thermomicrobiales bacterium]|uniref:D-aminoacyl-tRNA deacylase n=1 Tax=uncultured Thermomicrobiales bacterium TaxID=1645740 RepID=A0A6J4UQ47_9BACT|nr:MAG: D-aminoacyl-tRNA deacylase [uncultured Thermomicrobiales bacterium]